MPAVRSTTTLGDRAFMLAAPTLFNSVRKELRAITNVNSFKAHIKTFYIELYIGDNIFYSVVTCMHIHYFYCIFLKCIIFFLFLVK